MPLTPWSPRLTQAKAKRATAVAAAHEKLPQEGIRLRILAGRACDLAVAVSTAPAPDPAEIEARRGKYEAEMGEARRLFEDGSACLWYALRVGGFRGNFPESFGTSWPTSELHERQIFNTMPPHWACKEIATQQRIEALSRLLTAAGHPRIRAYPTPIIVFSSVTILQGRQVSPTARRTVRDRASSVRDWLPHVTN
jgi:hypothetical protein